MDVVMRLAGTPITTGGSGTGSSPFEPQEENSPAVSNIDIIKQQYFIKFFI